MGFLRRARDLAAAFWSPEVPEEREAARRAWERLPETARLPDQVLGTASAGCAATVGVQERCNLWCSACYLAQDANQAPPLPFEEVRRQLDDIRAHLGPWGNTQITSGEVTLLPCDDLVRILDHCRTIELAPMLMTNGTVLLEDPTYLERLVLEGGLDNLAIHVDTTQAGRQDAPPRRVLETGDETALMPLRERFADLVRDTRARTGRPLHAAHTVTVTDETLEHVPGLVRWAVANADAFRLLSLQPTAQVGRTTADKPRGGRAALWSAICTGLGFEANEAQWHFGDPDCSTIVAAFVVDLSGRGEEGAQRVVETTRKDSRLDRWFFRRLLHGGLAGWRPGGEGTARATARLLGRVARHPRLLLDVAVFGVARTWSERRVLASMAGALLRGRLPRVRPFAVVVHHFMDAAELETDRGRERLAACAFKVPVDGEMVSMCELNGTSLRDELNRAATVPTPPRRERSAPAEEPAAVAR